jgi:hypothetical protein
MQVLRYRSSGNQPHVKPTIDQAFLKEIHLQLTKQCCHLMLIIDLAYLTTCSLCRAGLPFKSTRAADIPFLIISTPATDKIRHFFICCRS